MEILNLVTVNNDPTLTSSYGFESPITRKLTSRTTLTNIYNFTINTGVASSNTIGFYKEPHNILQHPLYKMSQKNTQRSLAILFLHSSSIRNRDLITVYDKITSTLFSSRVCITDQPSKKVLWNLTIILRDPK